MSDLPIIRIRLLRASIGRQLSLLVTLEGGDLVEADIRPSTATRLAQLYDLVEAPDEEQNFETSKVIILVEKEKEEQS